MPWMYSGSYILAVLIPKVTTLSACMCVCSRSPMTTDLQKRRTEVVDKLQEFEMTIDPILTILTDAEVVKHLEESGK